MTPKTSEPNIRAYKNGVTIDCFVSPRSKKNTIKGVRDGAVCIALAAPPIEGRANEALIQFIAEILSVPKRSVAIIRGLTGRRKTVYVENKSPAEVIGLFYLYL